MHSRSSRHYHRLRHIIKQAKHHLRSNFAGVSFKWSSSFIPNVVLWIGLVFIWRGIRNLIDLYFIVHDPVLSNILSIGIGLLLLYLPDQSFAHLGGYIQESLEPIIKSHDPLQEPAPETTKWNIDKDLKNDMK